MLNHKKWINKFPIFVSFLDFFFSLADFLYINIFILFSIDWNFSVFQHRLDDGEKFYATIWETSKYFDDDKNIENCCIATHVKLSHRLNIDDDCSSEARNTWRQFSNQLDVRWRWLPIKNSSQEQCYHATQQIFHY